MKSRETKQKDLNALTAKLQGSKSAMVVSFSKATVNKDQEFRNQLREAGANYQVVKNTLARIAVKGTAFEDATEYFKGVTALAWTDSDPVILSKAISKFIKENSEVYSFKAGIVDGRVVNLAQVQSIASLPSKEELISKLLWVINAQAQRIVTVINAVPRNLAVVIKQIGDTKAAAPVEVAVEPKAEVKAEEAAPAAAEVVTETPTAEAAGAEESAPVIAEEPAETPIAEAAPAEEIASDVAEEVLEAAPEAAEEAPVGSVEEHPAPEAEEKPE